MSVRGVKDVRDSTNKMLLLRAVAACSACGLVYAWSPPTHVVCLPNTDVMTYLLRSRFLPTRRERDSLFFSA